MSSQPAPSLPWHRLEADTGDVHCKRRRRRRRRRRSSWRKGELAAKGRGVGGLTAVFSIFMC